MSPVDLAIALIAFLLTLGVWSYLLGDNPVYRLVTHTFIGGAAGYTAIVAFYTVIWPWTIAPVVGAVLDPTQIGAAAIPLVALVGGGLILLKSWRILSPVGGLVVAFLVGVGAAVAVGGAVIGTLIPQTQSAFVSLLPLDAGDALIEKIVEGLCVLIGTLTTLAFFHYGGRPTAGGAAERPAWLKPVAGLGEIFIGLTFGVMYAGAIAASFAAFAERLIAFWNFAALFIPQ
jgi:hypothetical protein